MRGSLTLARVRGIPIKAHWTLLLIVPYLAYLMAAQFGPVAKAAGVSPQAIVLPPYVWGIALAVLLFACVLAHELGHSLLALRYGGKVASITLMLLGGVSELKGLPKKPSQEALIAALGPLVSLAIGVAGLGAYRLGGAPADVRFGLFYLGEMNLILAVFNLLPAFPMDGGRVLRALLSTRMTRVRATRWAAGAGMVFSGLFVAVGLVGGNLILALIGVFIWAGAAAEKNQAVQEDQLSGVKVRDVMTPSREVVDGWLPATHAAWRLAESHQTALPVVEGGRLVGVVALHHLEALRPLERDRTPISAITQRNVPRLQAEELLTDALEAMAERDTSEAPVLEGGDVVGILEPNDLARALRLRKLAHQAVPRRTIVVGRPGAEVPGGADTVHGWL